MASAVDSRLAYARLSAVAMASRLPTANRGSTNSYTTSWDTTEGTGLGLPLAKSQMELHGGSLRIISQLNIGTTVRVHFPAERTAAAAAA